jgi:hypothetical protein
MKPDFSLLPIFGGKRYRAFCFFRVFTVECLPGTKGMFSRVKNAQGGIWYERNEEKVGPRE